MRYGDVSPSHRERFEPGSLRLAAAVPLNLFHDAERAVAWHPGGGLTFEQTPGALRMSAELPPIPAADRALAMIRDKKATGLSVEFRAKSERRESGLRIIEAAELSGIGIVRDPSYDAARVETRRREWINGGVRYGVEVFCECLTGDCNTVLFRPVALGPADGSDVLAIAGRNNEAVASTKGGTLRLRDTDDALEFSIATDGRDTAAGRALTDLARAKVPVYGRPIIDEAAATFTDEGGVRTFTKAPLRSILLKPISGEASRTKGWDPLDIPVDAPKRRRERARVWL